MKALWEEEFQDWERLVKVVGAPSLLDDPKAVWLEAWRVATMLCCQKMYAGVEVGTIQADMLKE